MLTWTGPYESDLIEEGTKLRALVSGERWPYGPPDHHEEHCMLHNSGLYCDCIASSFEDEDEDNGPNAEDEDD